MKTSTFLLIFGGGLAVYAFTHQRRAPLERVGAFTRRERRRLREGEHVEDHRERERREIEMRRMREGMFGRAPAGFPHEGFQGGMPWHHRRHHHHFPQQQPYLPPEQSYPQQPYPQGYGAPAPQSFDPSMGMDQYGGGGGGGGGDDFDGGGGGGDGGGAQAPQTAPQIPAYPYPHPHYHHHHHHLQAQAQAQAQAAQQAAVQQGGGGSQNSLVDDGSFHHDDGSFHAPDDGSYHAPGVIPLAPPPAGGDGSQGGPPSHAVPDENFRANQNLLNLAAGHHVVDPDGIPGPRTSQAISDLQRAHGLPQTGAFDSSTLGMLHELVQGGGQSSWTPAWHDPHTLADKQGMSADARQSLDALSDDSQKTLAWQSLTSGKTMEQLLKGG